MFNWISKRRISPSSVLAETFEAGLDALSKHVAESITAWIKSRLGVGALFSFCVISSLLLFGTNPTESGREVPGNGDKIGFASDSMHWISSHGRWLLYGVSGEAKRVRSLYSIEKEEIHDSTWTENLWGTLFYLPKKLFGLVTQPMGDTPARLNVHVLAETVFLLHQDREELNMVGRLREAFGNLYNRTWPTEALSDLANSNISAKGVDSITEALKKDSLVYVRGKQLPGIEEQIDDLRLLNERFEDLILSADRSAGFVIYGGIATFLLPFCLKIWDTLIRCLLGFIRQKYPNFYLDLPRKYTYYYFPEGTPPQVDDWLEQKIGLIRLLMPTLAKGTLLFQSLCCFATSLEIERTRAYMIGGLRKICCSILQHKRSHLMSGDGEKNVTDLFTQIHEETSFWGTVQDILTSHPNLTSVLTIMGTIFIFAGGSYVIYSVLMALPEIGEGIAEAAMASLQNHETTHNPSQDVNSSTAPSVSPHVPPNHLPDTGLT